LARRSSKNDGHFLASNARTIANTLAAYIADVPANRRAVWEIEFVNSAMNRIVFDGSSDIESGLLEAKAHTTSSGE
jgi:hypothetical protein